MTDSERLDWLEARAIKSEHVEINFTEAWTESGDYGSILSRGPREFWIREDETGPSLRAAIDAACAAENGEREMRAAIPETEHG